MTSYQSRTYTAGVDDQQLDMPADMYTCCDICGRPIRTGEAFRVGVFDDTDRYRDDIEMNFPEHLACAEEISVGIIPIRPSLFARLVRNPLARLRWRIQGV